MKVKGAGPGITQALQLQGQVKLLQVAKFGLVAMKWPRKRGPPKSPDQQASVADFVTAAGMVQRPNALDREMAEKWSTNSMLTWRDAMTKACYGKLTDATDTAGNVYMGLRVASGTIQALLDSITTDVGALLVRTTAGWAELPQGLADQILQSNGPLALPEWVDAPTAGDGGLLAGYLTLPIGYTSVTTGTANAHFMPFFLPAGYTVTALGCIADSTDSSASFNFSLYSSVHNGPSALESLSVDTFTGVTIGDYYESDLVTPYTALTDTLVFAGLGAKTSSWNVLGGGGQAQGRLTMSLTGLAWPTTISSILSTSTPSLALAVRCTAPSA